MIRKHITDLNDWYKLEDKFNWNLFALDTETTALHYDELELVGISLCDGENAYYVERFSPDVLKELLFKLKNLDKPTILMHNSVFDMTVLYKYGVSFDSYELFDTMVAYHLIDENDKKGLKHLAVKFLEADTVAYEEAEKAGELSTMFIEYAQNDAIWTYKLAMKFKDEVKNNNQEKLFRKIEMPFQKVLVQMKTTGVLVDEKLLDKQKATVDEELLKLESSLYEILEEPYDLQHTLDNGLILKGKYNFNSSHQLGEILFNKLGLDVLDTTKTGQPKTGKEVIEHYKHNVPFVKALEKYKIASQLKSLFLEPLPAFIQGDGRVRPNFLNCGTKTGRMAASRPNLQQLPREREYSPAKIRSLFTVPKGYKMFSVDYSGQEVYTMAHISKDKNLIKMLEMGQDQHLVNANAVFKLGIPEEKLVKSHPEFNQIKKKYKEERNGGKIFSFGVPYGMGEHKTSRDFNVSEEEAKIMIDNLLTTFPELKESIENTHKEVEKNGYVSTLMNRRRNFGKDLDFFHLQKAYRQSFNFKIQGLCADMIRAAAVTVFKAGKPEEWDLKPIMTIHDEFVYQVKEEYVEKAAKFVKKCFEHVTRNFTVPLIAEYEIGENYGNAK